MLQSFDGNEKARATPDRSCWEKIVQEKKDNNDSERTVGRRAAAGRLRFTTGSSLGGGAPQDPVQDPSEKKELLERKCS